MQVLIDYAVLLANPLADHTQLVERLQFALLARNIAHLSLRLPHDLSHEVGYATSLTLSNRGQQAVLISLQEQYTPTQV